MGKVATMAQAVTGAVAAGDTVVFAFTHNRSHAAVFELARQFRDRHCLTLVATGLLEYASILVAAGAVARTESAFAGNTYPAPSPSRQLAKLIEASGECDPDWTNLTMTLRLMAGAMGWPFVPTNSLHGSDLWSHRNRARIKDPFSADDATLIKALVPDVAFIHVPLADRLGNAIVHAPDAEESWGVWAAKKVVVTAERVVSPEEFRRIGPRTGIPAYLVDYVVEAPFGAHPQGQFVWTEAEGVASYAEDYAFRLEMKALSRDPKALRAWVEDWVFGTDHAAYLERLGKERLGQLRAEAVSPSLAIPVAAEGYSEEEAAAVLAMRVAAREATQGRAGIFFAGIGLSHLAAWAAEEMCREQGTNVDLVAETGMVGFHPMAGDPYLFNRPNANASLFHTSFVRTLGAIAGPRGKGCLAMLAAAQADLAGNINSSRSADNRFIVGSGGANDLGAGQSRVLVVMPLKPGRLVERLPFTTTRIRHLTGIATDLGLFEAQGEGEGRQIALAGVMCEAGHQDQAVAEVRAKAGFEVPVSHSLTRFDPPSAAELARLRRFDPKRELLA
jgi:acyl CoA:acetate/3-ketoacid CoA transferase alpha subunit/acyl CoA:acetate/3-ketoacid CoA transferase beta subunit